MFDFYDFTSAQFLDALADLYEAKGYAIQYLPFTYSVDFFPIGANATATRNVEINADADFVCTAFSHIAHDAAGVNIILPRVLLTLTIENNQRQLVNVPTVLGNLYGTGPRPGNLFKPLVLPANSTMSILATNLDNADRNIRLSHVGVKAFMVAGS
jgi:hypothetical protein